jgi:hypothetical protein
MDTEKASKAKHQESDNVSIDKNTLLELIKAIQGTSPKTPLEMMGLSKERQKALTEPGTPKNYRMIPGKSDVTGATFTLHVVESNDMRKFPQGRVVALADYKHPKGMTTYEDNVIGEDESGEPTHGRVPNGFPILKDELGQCEENTPNGKLSSKYLYWRFVNFWQRDLKDIVGQPLRAHHCIEEGPGKGILTPWQKGEVRTYEIEQE